MERNLINLTFDLEEFDIPQEYGRAVSAEEQISVTNAGLLDILTVLDKYGVRATFFTTGNYARQNPALVRRLAERHEIASHAMYHDPAYQFKNEDLFHSKKVLEEISGKSVDGFRMPRLQPFDWHALVDAGYHYDSSISPTWIPGRYNLLHENPLPSWRNGAMELPCSVSPLFRFPLFWLAFKNLPLSLYTLLCRWTLRRRKSLMLYFHPWEFADISAYGLPRYVSEPNDLALTVRLEKLILALRIEGTFVTCRETYEKMKPRS